MSQSGEEIDILYTNHRGEVRWRRVKPVALIFDTSAHHEGFQWLLIATDVEKNARRDFALKDILCIGADNMRRVIDYIGSAVSGKVAPYPPGDSWNAEDILKREG
jgi:hypothetical protein